MLFICPSLSKTTKIKNHILFWFLSLHVRAPNPCRVNNRILFKYKRTIHHEREMIRLFICAPKHLCFSLSHIYSLLKLITGSTNVPPQEVQVSFTKGESSLLGAILPYLFLHSTSSSTNLSIFCLVTLGITTTCAISSSHASCQRFTSLSSMGRSSTTVQERSFRRHDRPASVILSRRYAAVSMQ
mmetsp:Transcript_29330/g.42840  ORF Transcript_29330/g.42840 Transcript_29330/m.42840 type:complete len:185 (-) Transcript_29330:1574-2128(-)